MWFVPVGESAGADGGDEAADEDPADGNEGPDHTEPWETGASHDHEDWAGEEEWAPDEEPWVPNGDEDVNQAEHLGESWAADDEQQLSAQDEPWPADDPSHQAEPWKASDDDGPDEEQWKAADDEGSYEEQWEAADDEGPDHDEEQWEAADDHAPDEEQWKAADDEGPDEEQWKAADDEGPNHEEQWKAADEQGPNPTDMYPTWPRAPITNVTQEYPTKADRERLDVWWSKYKTNPAQDMALWLDAATDEECPKIPAKTANDEAGGEERPCIMASQLIAPATFQKLDKGMRFAERQHRWNNSEERKQVLQGMDINEMKRRDPKRQKVKDANRLARRVAYLRIEYQHRSGSYYILENPTGSMLFEYPCIKARLPAHNAKSINLCLGAVGAPSRKCVTLWGTAPFLNKLYEQLSGTRRNQLRRIQSFLKMDISRGYVDERGRARRVADLLDEHFKTLKPTPVVNELDMELMDSSDTSSSDSGLEDLAQKLPRNPNYYALGVFAMHIRYEQANSVYQRVSAVSKAPKGSKSAAGGDASAPESIDLSTETQPRHYTYVGKMVDSNGAAVNPGKGKLAKGGGKTHGKDGANVAGTAAGKAGGKSPGKDAGKSPGKDGGKSPGKGGGKSPEKGGGKTPGKDGGKTPGKDGGKSPGKDGANTDGKAGGKSLGKDAGKSPGKAGGKSPGKDAGKSPGKDGGKFFGKDAGKTPGKDSGKSAGKDGGKTPGKDGGKSPGKDGGKTPGKDGGKSLGKDGGKTTGKDGGKSPGKDGGKTPGKDEAQTGGMKGAKGGKQGKTKSPEASEPGSGKGNKGKGKTKAVSKEASAPEGKGTVKIGWALSGPADIPLQQRKALNEKLRRRMNNGQGLRKGLVAQWAATPPGSMARFEFLKAFLLDKDMSSIVAKEKEIFEELPLCMIKEIYEKVEGGKKFLAELMQSGCLKIRMQA
ncbi:NEFH [Symbiodinium sp. CCMP2592]|nr:NEFH [Symbiodinium sp. CCMP2592]